MLDVSRQYLFRPFCNHQGKGRRQRLRQDCQQAYGHKILVMEGSVHSHIYAEDVRALLGSTITFELIHPQDFQAALELQKLPGLPMSGSLNLAPAKRSGIQSIATADQRFEPVQSSLVSSPTTTA
jgi:hypothetical protein